MQVDEHDAICFLINHPFTKLLRFSFCHNLIINILYCLRYFVALIRQSTDTPIIVSSMGRSGSTLLYKSIFIALAKKNYPYLPNSIGQIISRGGIWNPNKKLFKGMVHKTHLHFSDLPKNIDAKVIFFSLPSDSVLSVISNRSRKGDL